MSNAKKSGQILKRLDPVNQWESFFAVVSGAYLYLFIDKDSKLPSSYYYIKGSILTEYNTEVSLKHNIILKNRFGECCLAFGNDH